MLTSLCFFALAIVVVAFGMQVFTSTHSVAEPTMIRNTAWTDFRRFDVARLLVKFDVRNLEGGQQLSLLV